MIRPLALACSALVTLGLVTAQVSPEIRGRLGSDEMIALDKLFDEVLSSEERRLAATEQDIDLLALCEDVDRVQASDFDAIVRRTQAVLDCEASVAATQRRITDVEARVTALVAASCRDITETVRQCRVEACGSDPRLISIGETLQDAPETIESVIDIEAVPLPESYRQCLSDADQLCLIDGFESDAACLEARRAFHIQRFVRPIQASAAERLSDRPQSFNE